MLLQFHLNSGVFFLSNLLTHLRKMFIFQTISWHFCLVFSITTVSGRLCLLSTLTLTLCCLIAADAKYYYSLILIYGDFSSQFTIKSEENVYIPDSFLTFMSRCAILTTPLYCLIATDAKCYYSLKYGVFLFLSNLLSWHLRKMFILQTSVSHFHFHNAFILSVLAADAKCYYSLILVCGVFSQQFLDTSEEKFIFPTFVSHFHSHYALVLPDTCWC